MSWFKRAKTPEPLTRLTRNEALTIAREAASGDSLASTLGIAEAAVVNGMLVWAIASVAIDATLTIIVDDATGVVLGRKRQSGLTRR